MCQASEGESSYLSARDKRLRLAGYNAQKAGTPREANPEPDHCNQQYSDKRQWWLGWDTAKSGQEPW